MHIYMPARVNAPYRTCKSKCTLPKNRCAFTFSIDYENLVAILFAETVVIHFLR